MSHDFDLALMGCGRAGAALLSRLAGAGLRVAVLDPRFADDPAPDGVTALPHAARLDGPHEVRCGDDDARLTARHVVVATGSRPSLPAGVTPDGATVITADRLPENTPERVLVAGGGARGLAAAVALAAAGGTVTLAEMREGLLPDDDPDVSAAVAAHVSAAGVTVLAAHRVIGMDPGAPLTGRLLDIAARGEIAVPTDLAVIATGRRARSRDLGLDTVAAQTDRLGRILVDARQQTAQPGVWALGSVVAASSSPDASIAEAGALAAALLDQPWQPVRYRHLPQIIDLAGVVAAWAGHTAASAELAGHATERRRTDGAHGIRIEVIDRERGVLLGVHAFGPGAGDHVRSAAAGLGRPVDDVPMAAAEEA